MLSRNMKRNHAHANVHANANVHVRACARAGSSFDTSLTDNLAVLYDPGTTRAFDKLTGDCVEIRALVDKPRYLFEGGHRTMGVIATTRILRLDLTKNQLRVALWLPMIARIGNLVAVSGAQAQTALGIERHLLSRILTVLVGHNLIRREARSLFQINPHYAWNGRAADHKTAIEDWDLRERLVVDLAAVRIDTRKQA
jgi:hypothetical protein